MLGEGNFVDVDWSSDEDLEDVVRMIAPATDSQHAGTQQQPADSQQQQHLSDSQRQQLPSVLQRQRHLSNSSVQQQPTVSRRQPAVLQRQQYLSDSSVQQQQSAALQLQLHLSDSNVQKVVIDLTDGDGPAAVSAPSLPSRMVSSSVLMPSFHCTSQQNRSRSLVSLRSCSECRRKRTSSEHAKHGLRRWNSS